MFHDFGVVSGLWARMTDFGASLWQWVVFLVGAAFAFAVADIVLRLLVRRPAVGSDGVTVSEHSGAGSGAPVSRPRRIE